MHTGLTSQHLKMALKIYHFLYKIDSLADHIHPFRYNFLSQSTLVPVVGQYTIALFRISLVELAAVVPTVFPLQESLVVRDE